MPPQAARIGAAVKIMLFHLFYVMYPTHSITTLIEIYLLHYTVELFCVRTVLDDVATMSLKKLAQMLQLLSLVTWPDLDGCQPPNSNLKTTTDYKLILTLGQVPQLGLRLTIPQKVRCTIYSASTLVVYSEGRQYTQAGPT